MSTDNLVLTTKNGPIRGCKKLSALNIEYLSFQKIPYAKPPVNELRFKAPVPVESWTAVLDCTEEGPACPALDRTKTHPIGNEDSLHLSVFTKIVDPKNLLPVMIYLHGGGFMRGSGTTEIYGPDYLFQRDVVFVLVNYRLGAFGFLSLTSPELNVPGNAGLKDQTLAMQWIRENISCFGGDPNNITLFGESAGASSVHYHMISDLSKGLFDRAILMSGCALNNWALLPQNKQGERLAKALGWDGKGGEQGALTLLQKVDPIEIIVAQEKILTPDEIENRVFFPFGPTIEPYKSNHCLISKDPILMCREAWGNKVDIMIGGAPDEGLFLLSSIKQRPAIMDELQDFQYLVPLELNLDRSSEKCLKYGKRLKALYYGNETPSSENYDGYIKLLTDKVIWHGLHRTILSRMNAQNHGTTFVYHFAADSSTQNGYRILFCDPSIRGTAHADDLCYLFKNAQQPVPKENTFEYKTIQILVDTFTSFATHGNPNVATILPIHWEPMKDSNTPYKVLNIANEGPSFIDLPEAARMALWDSMYTNEQLL